ncbi:hypothetical protein CEXT_126591 [Caerostris extrusa]|uniref:CCHC-type domain-containing protein n=1 Tax=Caerostris extrusa TaxID=172846 RepID=A0AAV4P3T8_CAEEX|nr:hypothetical protein CEXT_126591 [Caerostris extrusa]
MLVPKVNVLESGNRVNDKVLEAVQASGDTLAKTLNLVNRQLEHLNSRMDKIEAETKSRNGGNWQVNRQPVTCFHCNRPGYYMRDCYQRQAENRGRGSNHRGARQRAVAQIENDDKCLALVWNISDGPLHLNKNMILADIEPILNRKKRKIL